MSSLFAKHKRVARAILVGVPPVVPRGSEGGGTKRGNQAEKLHQAAKGGMR